jgi:hypothetical protein
MQHALAHIFHHISATYISSSSCTDIACGCIIHPTCCPISSITCTMSSSPSKAIFSCSIQHANHLAFAVAPSMPNRTSFAKASTTCLASSYKRQHHRPRHNTESPHLTTIKRSTTLPFVPHRPKSHMCPNCKWIGVAAELFCHVFTLGYLSLDYRCNLSCCSLFEAGIYCRPLSDHNL